MVNLGMGDPIALLTLSGNIVTSPGIVGIQWRIYIYTLQLGYGIYSVVCLYVHPQKLITQISIDWWDLCCFFCIPQLYLGYPLGTF
jgi:hypothetical protein